MATRFILRLVFSKYLSGFRWIEQASTGLSIITAKHATADGKGGPSTRLNYRYARECRR